ncbi:unnamed protein product [Cylindrotheca closterium]|uniref:Uncharacterized protein n=1 Tax=Cylindrotheca closterium TaxID=2856 RepID=A0AAD2FXY4_9STRA|nr:unnamed protein product [Cylindrotheca closterium]
MFKRFELTEAERKSSVRPIKPSSEETVTSATYSSCTSLEEDHFSYVSAITMDDEFGVSDRFTISDRYQYRLDPRLHSLKEQKRSSDPEMEEEQAKRQILPVTNMNRFSSVAEAADTKLCAAPRRRLSMSYRSAYSKSYDSLDSTCGNGESASSILTRSARSGSVDSCLSSASTDLDYRNSQQWHNSTFFLSEDNLDLGISERFDENEENDVSHSSYEEPLHEELEYDLPLGGESESKLPISHHEDTAPRRNYRRHGKCNPPVYGYSRSGISSQSLDLLDVFGDQGRRH